MNTAHPQRRACNHRQRSVVIVVFSMLLAVPSAAADFIRGDWNGDGEATWADVHAGLRFIFIDLGEGELFCGDAGDVNDDGGLNIGDPFHLMMHLALEDDSPAEPFSAPGTDPTDDIEPAEAHLGPLDEKWPCEADAGGSPFEDPAATLRVLDTVAEGGAARSATIVVAISSSTPIAGYVGSLDTGGIFEDGETAILNNEELAAQHGGTHVFDLSSSFLHGFIGSKTAGRRMTFSYLTSMGAQIFIPEGDRSVLEIEICLREGTPAGEYPLALLAGELVDYESGRAIRPELVGGTLTILSDVESGECAIEERPPFAEPEFDVEFSLGSGDAAPGESVVIPFKIRTTGLTQGYSFSVDFDEEVLEATEIEVVYRRQDGEEFLYAHGLLANNFDNIPGNTVEREGYVVGRVGISHPFDTVNVIPPGEDVTVLNFHFRVRPGAAEQVTAIRFADGARLCPAPDPAEWGCDTRNLVRSRGYSFPPELFDSFVMIDGFINIVGDVTVFRRGDVNSDAKVNVADALFLVDYLFSGGAAPSCMREADVSDTGRVTIASAVYLLSYLFGDGPAPAAPFAECGEDPTPGSGLTCLRSPHCPAGN